MVRESVPEGYKETEVGVIPEDWEVRKLGEFGKFKNGINKSKEDFGFGFPFVNLMNVFGEMGISCDDTLELVSSSNYERKLYNLKKGDVLFVRSSVKPEGVGLTVLIEDDLKDTVYSGFLIRFRDDNYLEEQYKKYVFYNKRFRKEIINSSTVSANTNINQINLKEILIAYPSSKKEQKAIAGVLSDVDELIASMEKLIDKKEKIKQGTMQLLLTGKKRLPGFTGDGICMVRESVPEGYKKTEVGVIPEDWEVGKIGEQELASIDSENLSANTDPLYSFKYISLEDVEQGVLTGFSEMKFMNSPSRARRRIRKGDVLLSTVRPNLKSHFLVNIDFNDLVCSTGFSVIRCNEKQLLSLYLYYHLFYRIIEKQINTLLTGSNYPAINSKNVKSLLFPLPPLPEQQAIAQILSDMDAEIESLQKKRDKYKLIKEGMMDKLLTGKVRLI